MSINVRRKRNKVKYEIKKVQHQILFKQTKDLRHELEINRKFANNYKKI